MPRGNPAVWKQHGASYAELIGSKTSSENALELAPRRLPPVGPGDVAAMRSLRPAGTPAGTLPRGAGTFALQNTWSLAAPSGPAPARTGGWTGTGTGTAASTASPTTTTTTTTSATASAAGRGASAAPAPAPPAARCGGSSRTGGALFPASSAHVPDPAGPAPAAPRTFATEARTHYRPPPPDYRRTRSAGAVPSEMPRPSYPNDWRTLKQVDYRPDALAHAHRPPPCPHRDAGRLLPSDVPPGGPPPLSTQRSTHAGRGAREAAAVRPSGSAGTAAAGYNIITGGPALGNGAFEAWDGRDYRRHR